ncbi:MAG: alpha/beta hydrolase [Halobacteriota archaeon]
MVSGNRPVSTATRRQLLAGAGAALSATVAGCLGGEAPEGTLEFDALGTIDHDTLPGFTQYQTTDRSTLTYRRYDSDADRVFVLLHGEAFDSKYMQPLASYLSENGVANVVTPDLRGHGPNPEKRGNVSRIGHLQADVDDLADHLLSLYGDDATFVVGGHSFSGGLAVRIAADPLISFADGYALLAPYLGRQSPTTRRHCGGWAVPDEDWLIPLSILEGFGIDRYHDRDILEFDVPDDVKYEDVTRSYTYRLDQSFTPPWHDEELVGMEGPGYVLVGGDDEAFVPAAYSDVFEPYDDVEVELIDGVTHLGAALDERCFEPLARWLETFD